MTRRKPLLSLADIPIALGLLTRLPIPVNQDDAQVRSAHAAWAYPFAGLVVAVLSAALGTVALWLGLTPSLAAGLIVATGIALTGALHEDGLADTADGLWGGWTKVRRLEIMKDSRIGTYGVLALILFVGLRWQAVATLPPNALFACLITSAMLSRAAMVVTMATLPHARPDGLSARVGHPPAVTAALACILAAVSSTIVTGWSTIPAIAVVIILATGLAFLAKQRIDGQTGDILGAVQVLTEVGCLLALSTLLVDLGPS
ncbi:MAG: adenosylcobinamide-GDP ribazoletransferase [Pseudomonadota bacterium]